ncbi:hypothetical protein [Pseudomonas sp. GM80]|jgi:hypothetical protein|uniref:hypothetical protein n=1 Tax=Pseudomonas sp. GM80 TaxID=1144339 RepID=UPI00138AF626|nr:hypothetical protein [Pseudomonas sp. GM80]
MVGLIAYYKNNRKKYREKYHLKSSRRLQPAGVHKFEKKPAILICTVGCVTFFVHGNLLSALLKKALQYHAAVISRDPAGVHGVLFAVLIP